MPGCSEIEAERAIASQTGQWLWDNAHALAALGEFWCRAGLKTASDNERFSDEPVANIAHSRTTKCSKICRPAQHSCSPEWPPEPKGMVATCKRERNLLELKESPTRQGTTSRRGYWDRAAGSRIKLLRAHEVRLLMGGSERT
jgi:hypothetical protein